jgi:hypothetical protein
MVADNALRTVLEDNLSNGLEAEVEQRSYSSEDVNAIVARLQALDESDYSNKMVTAGFTLKANNPGEDEDDDQACESCMYYLVHRKFCELPELMLPVAPEWSCRLWRI